jgi:hypothetical protein
MQDTFSDSWKPGKGGVRARLTSTIVDFLKDASIEASELYDQAQSARDLLNALEERGWSKAEAEWVDPRGKKRRFDNRYRTIPTAENEQLRFEVSLEAETSTLQIQIRTWWRPR